MIGLKEEDYNITIVCKGFEKCLQLAGARQFSDPSPADYEKIVRENFGETAKDFTVYYNRHSVCGRVFQ